jgi:hypothetical protein
MKSVTPVTTIHTKALPEGTAANITSCIFTRLGMYINLERESLGGIREALDIRASQALTRSA